MGLAGLTGFVSAALTQLKNNERIRSARKGMNEPKVNIVPTEYDFPEVSDAEREKVVQNILKNRLKTTRIIVLVMSAIVCYILYLLFGFLFFW